MKPLIGVSCCNKSFGVFGTPNHAASDTYVRAVADIIDAVPVLLPACPKASDTAVLLSRLDGILLTGSRSNVQPSLYGGPPHPDGTPEDPSRDGATIPLIQGAITQGLPVLAICRGMQELNVAMGGSLHQRLQDLPGRLDHSTPMQPSSRIRTGKAHRVTLTEGGALHRLLGRREIAVNSLHNQGVDRLAPGFAVEAVAPDGTIEAMRAIGAPGFVLGLQWHPEYDWREDADSYRLFVCFRDAVEARRAPDRLALKLAAD
jgi:putative glutamine amidotransferase